MRLVDPQPMETLPETGNVFVEHIYTSEINGTSHDTDEWNVVAVRRYIQEGLSYQFLAWSCTGTTTPE